MHSTLLSLWMTNCKHFSFNTYRDSGRRWRKRERKTEREKDKHREETKQERDNRQWYCENCNITTHQKIMKTLIHELDFCAFEKTHLRHMHTQEERKSPSNRSHLIWIHWKLCQEVDQNVLFQADTTGVELPHCIISTILCSVAFYVPLPPWMKVDTG